MTRQEFIELKAGDIVRVYRADGTFYRRTVLPSNGKGLGHHFSIRHKSWTGRMHTVIGASDATRFACMEKEGSTEMLMTPDEMLKLCEARFDIPKALRRECQETQGAFHKSDGSTTTKIMAVAALGKHFCQQP